MSRGTALATLRAYLKAELRDTQETNSAVDVEYNYALANRQKDLAFAYDWSFLEHRWDLACAAASRYLNVPTADDRGATVSINFERPVKVERLFNTYYNPVDYGISSEQYNFRNGVTQPLDPIMRWQLVTNVNEAASPNQIEIWPVPSTAQTLRFTGQRDLLALTDDTKTADLDDLLIVYLVAADYLAMRKQENAPLVLRKANERLVKLRAGYPSDCKTIVFGRNSTYERREVRTVPLVIVA